MVPSILCFHLILEFTPMNRFLRLSENQGAPALPLEFPDLSLTTSQNGNRSAPSFASSMHSSTSYGGDAERRSFNNDPTAFSATEVTELYPGIDAPLTVQQASDDVQPPQVAVLGNHAAGSATNPANQASSDDCVNANFHWFCASCGGNATASAFCHCLHCGLPRSRSSSVSNDSNKSMDDTIAESRITALVSSMVEILPEADLAAEVRET